MENVVQLKKTKKNREELRTEFLQELSKILGELRDYYGDDIEDFTNDCERARDGEVGITGSIKLMAWAKKQLAAFKKLDN